MTKARGFKKLVGVTITKADESCVNMVALWDNNQNGYIIDAEIQNGVPVLTLTKHKFKVGASIKPPKPRKTKETKVSEPWPFDGNSNHPEDNSLD
jgi:hypothetical protein